MIEPVPADEIDEFWLSHFGRCTAPIERHLIESFEQSVGAEDPLFPVLMMMAHSLYENLSSTEKAVLARGPELESRMTLLSSALEKVAKRTRDHVTQLNQLGAASEKLLLAHNTLTQQRALEARWEVVPMWVAVSVSSAVTVLVVLAGALTFAILT